MPADVLRASLLWEREDLAVFAFEFLPSLLLLGPQHGLDLIFRVGENLDEFWLRLGSQDAEVLLRLAQNFVNLFPLRRIQFQFAREIALDGGADEVWIGDDAANDAANDDSRSNDTSCQ